MKMLWEKSDQQTMTMEEYQIMWCFLLLNFILHSFFSYFCIMITFMKGNFLACFLFSRYEKRVECNRKFIFFVYLETYICLSGL